MRVEFWIVPCALAFWVDVGVAARLGAGNGEEWARRFCAERRISQ